MRYYLIPAIVIVCYFLGNINFALIIARLKKIDLRGKDSGNPGAMNMLRNLGTAFGVLTLILDGIKGASGAVIGWFVLGNFSFDGSTMGMYIGGAAVIVGHIYPVLLGFKGGKGIASSIGICFIINPMVTGISLAVGIVFILLTKMGAVTSFIIIGFPLAFKCLEMSASTDTALRFTAIGLMLFIFLLALFAHRGNLKKMFSNRENKTKLISRYKKATKS